MTEPATPRSSVGKVVLASFIGTAIEWYDFFLYGTAAALVFNKLFFPTLDPATGVMAAFSTYAVGFFARPIGGVVFGHFGDRLGRKSTLVVSLAMMGVSTFLIGLLPTYAAIGVGAPLLLVALRFVQGFGVGGEWGGAVLLAVEHGHKGRRGFNSSWVQVGVPAGQLLATAVFAAASAMPNDQFLAWGWRLPFLAGAVLLAVGMFIRLRILESPLFAKAKAEAPAERAPVLEVLRQYPGNVLRAMGARMAENVAFYVFTVFVLTYATDRLGLPRATILYAILGASGCQLVALPLFGLLSDYWGRRPVYMFGAVGMGLFAFPFFWLVDMKQVPLIWLALAVGLGVFHAAMYGPQAAFFAELFGTRVRYSGASLGYQLASPFAGGLAPLIATGLLQWSDGRPWPVAVYLIAMVLITLVSVYQAAETSRRELS
jgi:metabolite-proton symporter